MTKKIFLVLGGILLFAFVICTSFLWYKVFYYGDIGKINTLQVQKESDEVALNENLVPMTESEAQSVSNYKFSIKNVNDFKSSYKVVFEEVNITEAKLSKSQLNYELLLNGKIIKKGNLAKVKNNILDERYVMAGKTNNYELKVYIPDSVEKGTWENKSYAYKVNIIVKENN